MTTYRVKWEIDIDADTPEEAASKALEIQRDSTSTATCFDVLENYQKGNEKLHFVDFK